MLGTTYGLSIFVAFVTENAAESTDFSGSASLVVLFTLLVVVLFAATGFMVARLVYRMWAAIQDGRARTTPGRAVGFHFIPVFNLFWAFRAFPGFARDFNALVQRRGLARPRLSPGLFRAWVLLCMLHPVLHATISVPGVALISYGGLIISLWASYFVLLTMVARLCDALNAAAGSPSGRAPAAADPDTEP